MLYYYNDFNAISIHVILLQVHVMYISLIFDIKITYIHVPTLKTFPHSPMY